MTDKGARVMPMFISRVRQRHGGSAETPSIYSMTLLFGWRRTAEISFPIVQLTRRRRLPVGCLAP